MTELSGPERALAAISNNLGALGREFALIGGLAVSVRSEVRFTRDVDLVVLVESDADAEALIFELRTIGYTPIATVEHERRGRLATARIASPSGVVVDLMFASCGIEREVIRRASPVELPGIGAVPVACAEELIAMKVLSMTDRRLQDRMDAQRLLEHGRVDIARVRANLQLIRDREFERGEDLHAKLDSVLSSLAGH